MSAAASESAALVEREDRLAGILLGTALGDALGLPCEGMSAKTIARRFGEVRRFHFLLGTGFVSDDTEQSALVAQSVLRGRGEIEAARAHFRWAMLGWFWRLPWGIGLGTLRACLRLSVGLRTSGIRSAGNGASMRATILGGLLPDEAEKRRRLAAAIAEVTHTDPRAVAGAQFVADLAAACVRRGPGEEAACLQEALALVEEPSLRERLERARALQAEAAPPARVLETLGASGFVLESVPMAAYCFLAGGDPPSRLSRCIAFGGDTDTNAAMLGGWLGALHGAAALPADLVERLQDGPFGKAHLRRLARALAHDEPAPRYFWPAALARNLALYPVVLAHGFRRLVPF